MAMNALVKQLAQLQRQREALRAKIATATNDLADVDLELRRVAAVLTGENEKAEK